MQYIHLDILNKTNPGDTQSVCRNPKVVRMSKPQSDRQPGVPSKGWSIKNFPAHERAVATRAAQQSQLHYGEWLEETIKIGLEAGEQAIASAAAGSDVGGASDRMWSIKGIPRPSQIAVTNAAGRLRLNNGQWLAGAVRLRMQVENRPPQMPHDQTPTSQSLANRLVEICGEVAKLAQAVAKEGLAASMVPSTQRDGATVIFIILGDGQHSSHPLS